MHTRREVEKRKNVILCIQTWLHRALRPRTGNNSSVCFLLEFPCVIYCLRTSQWGQLQVYTTWKVYDDLRDFLKWNWKYDLDVIIWLKLRWYFCSFMILIIHNKIRWRTPWSATCHFVRSNWAWLVPPWSGRYSFFDRYHN